MKVALISDLHYGVRHDNPVLLDHLKKFFDIVFFPYLEEHNINVIFVLGDLLDKRKSVNINTAKRMRKDFLAPLKNKQLHIIIGNHDTYNKNTNKTNSLMELLHGYANIQLYIEPTELPLNGLWHSDSDEDLTVLMLPWICPENEEESLILIKKTKAQVCFAHLELMGWEHRKGGISDKGLDLSLFSKFDLVVSGHYHYASTKGNIHYLGAPYQITWNDYGDTKGFSIFDTKTRELEFVENPNKLFRKIIYNDDTREGYSQHYIDDDKIRNTYVKLVVERREDIVFFDKFVRRIESLPVIDLQIVDNQLIQTNLDEEHIDQAESTLDILHKTIKTMDIKDEYRKDLDQLFRDLYNEASLINA